MGKFDTIQYIDDPVFDAKGKRVLVRVDFNVPQDENGLITSSRRIREAMQTIDLLRAKGGRIILMSHLGRPKGKPDPKYSLKTVSLELARMLGIEVHMAPDCVGQYVEAQTRSLKNGQVLLLENVRFHQREEKDADAFGKDLARNGDIFVNDAFGSCHRAHGSVSGVAKYLPHFAGLLVRRELEAFGPLLDRPQTPYVAVLGGAKVSDKIGVIKALLDRADTVIIGGAMAYTFLKAAGYPVGKSLVDNENVKFAHEMFLAAAERGVSLLLPEDHVVAASMEDESAHVVDRIPDGMAGFDIGPKTVVKFTKALATAQTVIFNGPMGVFEKERFSNGTKSIVQTLAELKSAGSLVVVGGGDSAAAVEAFGVAHKVTHVSTGGGASLELLEGLEMPGLAALSAPQPR